LYSVPVRVVGDDLELGTSHTAIADFPQPYLARSYDLRPDGRAAIVTAPRNEPSKFNVVVNLGRQLTQSDNRGAAGR
jgi:hypothetical protein